MSHEPKNTITTRRVAVSHNFLDEFIGFKELGDLSDKKIDKLWEQARAQKKMPVKSQSVGIER